METACHEVLDTVGRHHRGDPILKVALELERIALSDEYFIENKLRPNIDFYSAIALKALGFPDGHVHRDLRHRPHGGLGCAVEEMIDDSSQRIGRPRQLYTGATERTYVRMEARS